MRTWFKKKPRKRILSVQEAREKFWDRQYRPETERLAEQPKPMFDKLEEGIGTMSGNVLLYIAALELRVQKLEKEK